VLRPGGKLHVLDVAGRQPARSIPLARTRPDHVLAAMFDAGLTHAAHDGRARALFGRVVFYRASR
jgi:hypothetical protein